MDAIDPCVIMSNHVTRTFDFGSIREEELHDIVMPLRFEAGVS